MSFLRLPIAILLLVLVLILGVLLFLKTQLSDQNKKASPPAIPIFLKTPSPTPFIPYEQLSQEEKMRLQTESDNYYAKTQDELLRLYPWYNTLPIMEDAYFVYFDLDKKQFNALLYPQKSSSQSIDTQVAEFKKEVTRQLKITDPNTLKFPIIWEIKPK